MIGPVCEGCGTVHPDLHLPPNNAKDKTLAMDDRDIKELIDILTNTVALVPRLGASAGFTNGYTSCTDTVVGLLNNYVAAA